MTAGGATTHYALDVAGGLPEVIAATGGATTHYLQVQGQVLAQYDSGTWGYVAPDALGSVRQVVDPAGSVSLAQSYDPFGNLLSSAGSASSVFGYTGEPWDSQAELLYLRARHYRPDIGRFLILDPWPGEPLDPRSLPPAYLYAGNNPVNRVDPSGQISIHFQVILYYAARYYLVPEYIIPTTVPPYMPSWARWGWRVDLADWNNYEIYEVEPTNVGAPYMAGHGREQVKRYLDELNNAYGGIGIGLVHNWEPGKRVGRINFLTSDGFVEVNAWLNEPGVIVFEAHWTQKALEFAAVMCLTLSGLRMLRGLPRGILEPQPATLPPWLSPDLFPPMPTAIDG
jgi:RHS repeat-associated protein